MKLRHCHPIRISPHRIPRIRCGLLLRMSCRSVVSLWVIRAIWQTPKSRIPLVDNDDWNYFSVRDSDVNKATSVKVKATATCCRSTASARQCTTDESTFMGLLQLRYEHDSSTIRARFGYNTLQQATRFFVRSHTTSIRALHENQW